MHATAENAHDMSVIVDAIAFLHSMPFRRRMSNAEAHETPITLGLEAPMNYVASCSGTAITMKSTCHPRNAPGGLFGNVYKLDGLKKWSYCCLPLLPQLA